MEGNLRFKIDWASLEAGRKFTVFALFYFAFECKSTSPRGAYIWRDYLTEGFLRHGFGGFIFGGAYTWSRDRAEGGAGGALAPPLFCKNKNKFNKK